MGPRLILIILLSIARVSLFAADGHVAPNGSDTAPGTKDKPLLSLEVTGDGFVLPGPSGQLRGHFVGSPQTGFDLVFERNEDGRWQAAAGFVPGQVWTVCTDWKDSWYGQPQHIKIQNVEAIGRGQARGTATAVVGSQKWNFADVYTIQDGFVRIERTFEHADAGSQTKISLINRVRMVRGDDLRMLVPGSLYNGNPGSTMLGPSLSYEPGSIGLYEEHRLPIPMVNVESQVAGRRLHGSLLAQPGKIPQGHNYDAGQHRWLPAGFHGSSPGVSSRQFGEVLDRLGDLVLLGRKLKLDVKPWEDAFRKGCDFLVASPCCRGLYPRAWNIDGTPLGWRTGKEPVLSAAGASCIWPLLKMAKISGEKKYLDRAVEVMEAYAKQFGPQSPMPPWGATLDAGGEDKEAGWELMHAALDVYEANTNKRFLDLAQWAADWTLTWMYFHDIGLRKDSVLYGHLHTIGWTLVSTQNQEIDVFAYWMAPDYYRLGSLLHDPRYQQIAKVMYDACTQTIARPGRMFGQSALGIQAEHYNHTNCTYVGGQPGTWRGTQHAAGISWVTAGGLYGGMKLVEMAPEEFRLSAASEESPLPTSRRTSILWRYTFGKPPDGWLAADFDDSRWKEGRGGFGEYGTLGGVVGTLWKTPDIWLRRLFSLGTKNLSHPHLLIHHDDDAEVYINGVLAARLTKYVTCYEAIEISPEATAALRPGKNVLALHCHQESGGRYIDAGIVESPLVATSYFYWYDAQSMAHVVNPDGTDALTDHPPTLAGFGYKSVDWHAQQLADMVTAGIDVLLPVYWGTPLHDQSWSDEGLPKLVTARERLLAQGKTPPAIGMFYDTSTLRYNKGEYHVDLTTPAGRLWFYGTIRNFFSQIPPRQRAKIDGKPLVFLYASAFARRVDEQLFPAVRVMFRRDFGTDLFLVKMPGWPGAADSEYQWGGALTPQFLDTAALGPGYDHSAVPGRAPLIRKRENGQFYQRGWQRLLMKAPESRPWLVHVETWNEFHEGTDICQSREYGRQYIELTRKFADQFHARQKLDRSTLGPARQVATASPGQSDGLSIAPQPEGDGPVVETTVQGRPAWSTTQNKHSPTARYLYFKVDGTLLYDMGDSVEVTVVYLDGGPAEYQIQYDSSDPKLNGLLQQFRPAPSQPILGTGQWKEARFILPYARFAGRSNGADFRLAAAGKDLVISRVSVRRLDK